MPPTPLDLIQYSVRITLEGLSRLPHLTLLQHHILALSITAITTFALGVLVFIANPKKRLNQVFGLYSLSIFWWATSEAFFVSAPNPPMAELYANIEWPGVFFIAPTFFHSVCLLTSLKSLWSQTALRIAYGSSFLFLALHFLFDAIALSPQPVAYLPVYNLLTPIGFSVPIAFFVLVNLGLWKLYSAYRQSSGQRQVQLRFLFWGSLIGYLGGSPDWFLIFGFAVPGLNPFGIYGVSLYSIAITYAVFQHRLFNVNLVIRKSLIYSLLVTALTIGYFCLVYIIERMFQTTFGYQSVGLSLAAFALMALIFQPLKVGIQRLVDLLLFRAPREELVKKIERLEGEVRLTDKLRAVSKLAAGLAHEIKNPLSAIKIFTEHLEARYDEPEFRAKFQRIVGGEVERINLIVQQLLELAKPMPPKLVPVDVPKLLEETLELLNSELVNHHVRIRRHYEDHEQVLGDRQQLKQVFINLILNSLQAVNGRGRLELRTTLEGPNLAVTIADNGCGIAPKNLPRLFEPFYTTKATGTGLGLAIVHGIVREHGGRVAVESRLGQGTRLILHLPLAS